MPLDGDELAGWLRARAGKLTASRMATALNFKKDGTSSKERSDYMRELLAERMTGDSVRHFVTDAMQFGLDMEPEAKDAYQAETGTFIRSAGFYDHPRIENFGATPDGLLDGGGLIEIKVPTSQTFVAWLLAGVVPAEHKPQMLAQLACTGRRWCEFVAYNPRVKDLRRRLFIRRYEPTPDEITTIEAAAESFLAELDRLWDVLQSTPV